MECIKLTQNTVKWFMPLLPAEQQRLLRDEPNVFAIGAISDKRACGVLLFRAEETAEVLYLAVSDAYRRQGAGRAMLDFLCAHAWRSTTPVACTFSARDKTDPRYLFFAERDDFTVGDETGFVCRLSADALLGLSLPNRAGAKAEPFFSLPAYVRADFFASLRAREIWCMDGAERELLLPALCLCTRDEQGVNAAILVSRQGKRDMAVAFAYCTDAGRMSLISLLTEVRRRIADKAPPDMNIYLAAVTPQSAALAEHLLPACEKTEQFYRAVWDMDPNREV